MQENVSAPDGAETRNLSPAALIFLASVLGLFLELALIRWVSSEVRIFAYAKNLVLVACFLGFGAGLFRSDKKLQIQGPVFVLLLIALVVRLPWQTLMDFGPRRVTGVLAELSGLMVYHVGELDLPSVPLSAFGGLAFALFWTTLLFFMIALTMIPFGQVVGANIPKVETPLKGYSINVAGSLLGILGFSFVTAGNMPPVVWFVPVTMAMALLTADKPVRQAVVGISLALLVVFLPNNTKDEETIWSSYQKLGVHPSGFIEVNNIGYQTMVVQGPSSAGLNRFNMAHSVRPGAKRVLVIGAGSGNDVSAALLAGAESVVAVEIDRVIYEVGTALHPDKPYSDPRVRVVIDDARHFLKTTDQKFDLIVFSHLDAHTVLSSYTNVRLDNYIHTTESFAEARRTLAPDGLLYVTFFSELPIIGPRLSGNLEQAFGHPPVSVTESGSSGKEQGFTNLYFLIGESDLMTLLAERVSQYRGLDLISFNTEGVGLSTDEWPFLQLQDRSIPPMMWLISAVILLLSVLVAWRVRPTGDTFDGHLFFLGAAFMLLEVHNVSRLALVFGTTWTVNAWVIGTILSLILLANAVVARVGASDNLQKVAAAGLFLTLALAFFVPLDIFVGSNRLVGGIGATTLMTAPIFFAGLVFAQAFSTSPSPGFALGWNILGSVVGAMCESLSYLLGIPALVIVAGCFYVAAFIWLRFGRSPA